MNNLKYENEMNDLDDKENKQIEGLDTEGLDIAKDIGIILVALGGRIQKEESVIYKKFDEISA